MALLTFGQIPLGAVTVLFNLNPLLVMSHFLVAVIATGAVVLPGVDGREIVEVG